jgi:hypothetical protein
MYQWRIAKTSTPMINSLVRSSVVASILETFLETFGGDMTEQCKAEHCPGKNFIAWY